MGMGIAISRANPAPVVGHLGWAFQLQDGSFMAGATEAFDSIKNWPNLGHIAPGANNDAWALHFDTLDQVLAEFASTRPNNHVPYNWWKSYDVAHPNFAAASRQANANKGRGWDLFGNNCLDHSTDVLAAYGVPWSTIPGDDKMPWKQSNPTPIGWLNAWKRPVHTLSAGRELSLHMDHIYDELKPISETWMAELKVRHIADRPGD